MLRSLLPLLLLLLLLCSCLPVSAGNCCYPAQWEGGMYSSLIGFPKNSSLVATFAFDLRSQRAAMNITTFTPGSSRPQVQRSLQDGRTQRAYHVNGITGRCQVVHSPRLQPICIPPDYKKTDQFFIGASTERIGVQAFSGSHGGFKVTMVASQRLCVPVWQQAVDGGKVQLDSVMNVTLGIRDRTVLDIPPECRGHEMAAAARVGPRVVAAGVNPVAVSHLGLL